MDFDAERIDDEMWTTDWWLKMPAGFVIL